MTKITQRLRQYPTSKDVQKLNPGFYGLKVPEGKAMPELGVKVEKMKTTDEQKLNRLETEWLAVLRDVGYPWIGIQAVTIKIGDRCRYTPDFIVLNNEGAIIAFETKGKHFWDDAKVKLKVAARQFPFIRFILVTKVDGQFQQEDIRP